jgi:hypothetical protein
LAGSTLKRLFAVAAVLVLAAPAGAQLAALQEGGVEWIALTPRWLQAERDSTRVAPHPELSPSDASLRSVIAAAHALGLHVFLKPQLDLVGPGWRGEIAFRSESDWRAWFQSYQAFILHYAALAEEERVSLFSVGVELDATRHREADWREIIGAVRAHYAGPLVYAANWGRERDITWWDALDYAGVDAYFPVANSPEPSAAEVAAGWRPHLASLSSRLGLPSRRSSTAPRSRASGASPGSPAATGGSGTWIRRATRRGTRATRRRASRRGPCYASITPGPTVERAGWRNLR